MNTALGLAAKRSCASLGFKCFMTARVACLAMAETRLCRMAPWAVLLATLILAACSSATAETVQTRNPPVADPAAIPPSPRLALVLSSGGPRGFAHIGVLKVLTEAGIRPDIIVGTSSGALVGVLFAA